MMRFHLTVNSVYDGIVFCGELNPVDIETYTAKMTEEFIRGWAERNDKFACEACLKCCWAYDIEALL